MRDEKEASEQQQQGTRGFGTLVGNRNLIILNVLSPCLMIIAESTEPYGRSASVMMQRVGQSRRQELQPCKNRSGDSITFWEMLI